MTTEAKMVKFRRQLKAIDAHKKELAKDPEKRNLTKMMEPREKIKVRLRCKICGRGRAVYRKFGICRICFRNMASDGLIPGVKKASW